PPPTRANTTWSSTCATPGNAPKNSTTPSRRPDMGLIGGTRPLQELRRRLHGWGHRNSSRTLPWYRKHTADAIGLAWIGALFATRPRRTWRRLREYRHPTPRPATPKLNPKET